MDYTKVPRSIIYQDKTDIGEFGIDDESSLMGRFYNGMLDQKFMRKRVDAAEILLEVFNNAFYLCTLITIEKRPRIYLPKYVAIASDNNKDKVWEYEIMPSTMALVYSLLVCSGTFSTKDKFMLSIVDYFRVVMSYGSEISNEIFFELVITPNKLQTTTVDKNSEQLTTSSLPDLLKFNAREIPSLFILDSSINSEELIDGLDYILCELLNSKYEDAREWILPLIEERVKDYFDMARYFDDKPRKRKSVDATIKLENAYEKMGLEWKGLYAEDESTNYDDDQDLSEAESNIFDDTAQLQTRIKELEEEKEQLRKENEELKEYKALMDTPLDGIEADSKVGLAIIMKLMKNDGANFEKSKNKMIGAQAMKMMTGRSESACKQIFSVPLSKNYHAKKIYELNGYLQELGMKTLL